jgi:uncharacterized protein (DUF342 family)
MSATRDRPWITIAPDRLSARLRLPGGSHVDLATARDLLASLGLRHGIDPDVLRAAGVSTAEERDLVIAAGDPPPDLSTLAISPLIEPGVKVIAGQMIASCLHRGPVTGVGVDGQPVPPSVIAGIGCGVLLQEDGAIIARRDGVLRKGGDGTLKVVIDGIAEVELATVPVQVDAKTTEAWFDLLPRHYIPAGVLHRVLGEQRIVRGVRGEAFAEASLPLAQPRRLRVAHGIPAKPGDDGRLDMKIDEQVHLKVDTHGRVDWHDHGRSEDVDEATPLARILPPTAGVHGVDVRGAYLEPKPGRPLDPARVIGEGTRLSVVQPDLIESACPGHFFRDRQRRLCVQPRLIVEGDVDFRHGNIDTKLSVLVKGDVKAGFSIKSAGDIEVLGVIEDARISAQGRLIVKGGILPGSNRVKAHGDIDARYVSNREVKCHTLRVGGSLRWSRVLVTGEVIAKEILGGDLICAGNVAVDQLGNADGLPTRVQVGTNPFDERLFITAKEEHDQLVEAVRAGKERCKLIAHQVALDPNLSDQLRAALEGFSAACTRLANCETALERHALRQQERASQQVTAMVQVSGMAHRGVELQFDEVAKLVLDQDLAKPNFRMQDGAIVW